MNIPNAEELKRKAEIDRLLSLANVQKMRGEFVEGEDTCKRILELDPENILAGELMADLLFERGKIDDAAAKYKALMEREPKRASLEAKYARAVLEIGERDYQKQLAQDMLDNPGKYVAPKRSGAMSVLLSIVAPGVGHMFAGQMTKGIIILSVFLLSWAYVALSPGTHLFVQQLGDYMKNPRMAANTNLIDPIAVLCMGIGFFTYIYALIDAGVIAGKASKGQDIT